MKLDLNDPAIQTPAQRIARAAAEAHKQQTGHEPKSVRVVVSEKTVTVTLHDNASQAAHRKCDQQTSQSLCEKIQRITGLPVLEAGPGTELASETSAHPSDTQAIVQKFLLAKIMPSETFEDLGMAQPLPATPRDRVTISRTAA